MMLLANDSMLGRDVTLQLQIGLLVIRDDFVLGTDHVIKLLGVGPLQKTIQAYSFSNNTDDAALHIGNIQGLSI